MVKAPCTHEFWIPVAIKTGLDNSGTTVTDRAVLPQGGSSKRSPCATPSAYQLPKQGIHISHIHAKLEMHTERAVAYFRAPTVQSVILPTFGALELFSTL